MTEPPTDDPHAAAAKLTAYVNAAGLEWELGGREQEYVVTLPGDKKLKTVVSLLVRDRYTSVSAFVIRHPDENEEEFYRTLLRKNLRLTGIAYAIDNDGDVFVRGQLPTAGLDADQLDQLFGVILMAADDAFNELLVIGFLTSMKKEWDWRISRGESTRNLDAFRHLLDSDRPTGELEDRSTDSDRPTGELEGGPRREDRPSASEGGPERRFGPSDR